MKLLPALAPVLASVLVALTSTGVSAQELEFKSVTTTKELTGTRKGRQVVVTLEGHGPASVQVREADGRVRTLSGQATQVELTAARRAFRAAHVEQLPQHILAFDATAVDDDAEEGSLRLQSILPDARETSTTADLGRYDDYAPRIEPVVAALDAIGKRLVSEARAGFKQITLGVRATGGPTPGATSVFNLQSAGRARLDRRVPNSPAKPACEGQATPDELKRVAAALEKADLDSIPDGRIVDTRDGASVSEINLVIVRADGTQRTISARRDLYGKHQLAELVDALDAIARRLVRGDGSMSGSIGGAADGMRGLTDALRGH